MPTQWRLRSSLPRDIKHRGEWLVPSPVSLGQPGSPCPTLPPPVPPVPLTWGVRHWLLAMGPRRLFSGRLQHCQGSDRGKVCWGEGNVKGHHCASPRPISLSWGWDFKPMAPAAPPFQRLLGLGGMRGCRSISSCGGSGVTSTQGAAVVDHTGLPHCCPSLQAAPQICGKKEQGFPKGIPRQTGPWRDPKVWGAPRGAECWHSPLHPRGEEPQARAL